MLLGPYTETTQEHQNIVVYIPHNISSPSTDTVGYKLITHFKHRKFQFAFLLSQKYFWVVWGKNNFLLDWPASFIRMLRGKFLENSNPKCQSAIGARVVCKFGFGLPEFKSPLSHEAHLNKFRLLSVSLLVWAWGEGKENCVPDCPVLGASVGINDRYHV